MTPPLVMKFGGSSVRDAERMRQVARLARAALDSGEAPLVVLSAAGKTTDALFSAAQDAERGELDAALRAIATIAERHVALARDLIGDPARRGPLLDALRDEVTRATTLLNGVALLRELSGRSRDSIVSLGELLSTRIFRAFLVELGVDAPWVDARQVLVTDATFGGAEPDFAAIRSRVASRLETQKGRVVVTQGYIGSTRDGLTTTLGRGGSDYSAALFGAAMGAREVQIWTDVEGILTADPRLVPNARPIDRLTFAEAAELAAFGAKVLHPRTIQPAVEALIPVTVRHTLRPEGRFTTITASGEREARPREARARAMTALASRGPITVLTVASTRMLDQSGFLSRMFEVFARHGVSVDVVATAEVSVSLTVDPGAPIEPLRRSLVEFAEVEIREDRALVAIVGESLRDTRGQAARAFGALKDINVEMISMGANEINLSLVVKQADEAACVRALHAELFERNGGEGEIAA
jgi:aspartate kinase